MCGCTRRDVDNYKFEDEFMVSLNMFYLVYRICYKLLWENYDQTFIDNLINNVMFEFRCTVSLHVVEN